MPEQTEISYIPWSLLIQGMYELLLLLPGARASLSQRAQKDLFASRWPLITALRRT
jgi:hypothetical protein